MLATIGVDLEKIVSLQDDLFGLDSRSNPDFRVGARLRPVVDAAFASLVMHYSGPVQ